MSWLVWFAIVYGAMIVALWLVLMHKPFHFNWLGDRKSVSVPVLKLLITAWLSLFILVSLLPHILCRFVGFRGFYNKSDKSYTTQNPFRRA